MSTLRKRATAGFTMVPNAVYDDERLSLRAKGLLGWLLRKPDGWDVRSEAIAKVHKEGRDAVRAALAELGAAGYYRRTRYRMARGRWGTETEISAEPVAEWADAWAAKGDQVVEVPSAGDTLPTEDGFPGAGEPGVGAPGVGAPGVVVPRRESEDEEEGTRAPAREISVSLIEPIVELSTRVAAAGIFAMWNLTHAEQVEVAGLIGDHGFDTLVAVAMQHRSGTDGSPVRYARYWMLPWRSLPPLQRRPAQSSPREKFCSDCHAAVPTRKGACPACASTSFQLTAVF